jgi:peptide/nickel transport system permease protein
VGKYLVRRTLSMIPTLLGITIIVFVFIELAPGDAAMAILAGRVEEEEIAFTEEELAKLRREMGLDRPAPIRYLEWLGNLLRAELGVSLSTRRPVADLVSFRLGPTMELMGAALLLSSVLGLSLGVVSALKRYTAIDHTLTVAGMMGISTPTFYVGLLALFLLSVQLGLFPLGGRVSPGATGTAARLHHLVLPAFILGLDLTAALMRYTRSSVLEVLRRDYVTTARSKGLPGWRVILVHAFRNALIPIIVILGLRLPILIGGSVVIETVFNWPGMGAFYIGSVRGRDYPIIMAVTLFSAVAVLVASVLVDVLTAVADPRVRLQSRGEAGR